MKANQLVIELNASELENINGGVLPAIGVWAIVKGICLIAGSTVAGAATGYVVFEMFN